MICVVHFLSSFTHEWVYGYFLFTPLGGENKGI